MKPITLDYQGLPYKKREKQLFQIATKHQTQEKLLCLH